MSIVGGGSTMFLCSLSRLSLNVTAGSLAGSLAGHFPSMVVRTSSSSCSSSLTHLLRERGKREGVITRDLLIPLPDSRRPRAFSTSGVARKDSDGGGDPNEGFRPVFKNPFAKNYGKYNKVMPGDVDYEEREIPDHIVKPDYWASGHPTLELTPRTIEIKSPEAIEKMRKACALARQVLNEAAKVAKPGVTTQEIDDFVFHYTIQNGAYPSPLNYRGFPKSVCTSVNNVACHGIPDDRALEDGDIINIDVMVYIDGYHGDCSTTVMVGNVDAMGRKLVEAAKACLDYGVMVCGPGVPFQRIGQTIQDVAEEKGFTVVPCFTGHGIGHQIHSAPESMLFKKPLHKPLLDFPYPGKMEVGMTFTVEPVITQGMENVIIMEDGWTAVMLDGGRTAQFEHTILITEYGADILTLPETPENS